MRDHATQRQTVPADASLDGGFSSSRLLTWWIKFVLVAGSSVHCRMFRSIPGLYSQMIEAPSLHPFPNGDNQNCVQKLPDSAWGAKSPLTENYRGNPTCLPVTRHVNEALNYRAPAKPAQTSTSDHLAQGVMRDNGVIFSQYVLSSSSHSTDRYT